MIFNTYVCSLSSALVFFFDAGERNQCWVFGEQKVATIRSLKFNSTSQQPFESLLAKP